MENQLQTNQKKIDGITYLILFLSGLLGISLGYIALRLEWILLAMVFSVFSAFIIIGLILNKNLIEQNNLLYAGFQQENLIRKNNILSAFIKELEHNSNAEHISQFKASAWRSLKTELFVFPDSLYDVVEDVYHELSKVPDLQRAELKDYLFKESKLTAAIAALRDQQQKIKRNMI